MSVTQAMTIFESLPNEILIECFEYLNATDILHSCDFLNSRFSQLIRNIPLHLNLEEIEKSSLVQFCVKMLLNPQIKEQIRSVILSTNNTFDTIQTLFSSVSLNEFPQIRALILSHLSESETSRISSMLPSLTNLRYCGLRGSNFGTYNMLVSLSTSTVQTLSIPGLLRAVSLTHPFTSLVNLTVSYCSTIDLCTFVKCAPELQDLHVALLAQSDSATFIQPQLPDNQVVRLKRLVIDNCLDPFDALQTLLRQTPNLTLLVISSYNNSDMVNACRWRKLIQTSLPLLHVFKFYFSCGIEEGDSSIVDKCQLFQTNFCHHQYDWHNEYVLSKNRALIYTIPYMSNKYEISPGIKRYYNPSFNSTNTFANVTDLILHIEAMTNSDQYYFPNVKSLELSNSPDDTNGSYPFLKMKHIECLRKMLNLHNLTHLAISSECRWKSSSVLIQLFKEALHLSSLDIAKNALFTTLNKRELCECLKKRITILKITGSNGYEFLDSNEIMKLCEVFSGMKEFRCDVGLSDNLKAILNELSKLSHMKLFSYKTPYYMAVDRWLKDNTSELGLYAFQIKCQSNLYQDDFDDDISSYYDSD